MNSSMATRSSSRARFEPTQRWMPSPKAAWRLRPRSMMNLSASSKDLRVTVRGGKSQQDPVILLHRGTVELVVLRDETRHGDGRVEAQELLDRDAA